MYLRCHAPPRSCLKYASRVLWREEALVTEHVDVVGKMLTTNLGYHLVNNKADILLVAILPSHGMGTKKRRHYTHGKSVFHASDDTQHLKLISSVETIPALYLYAPRSLSHHLTRTSDGLVVELFLCHGMEQVSRIEYTSATSGYLLVA